MCGHFFVVIDMTHIIRNEERQNEATKATLNICQQQPVS